MEEKRGGQIYQHGQVEDLAISRKTILSELEIGILHCNYSILNLIPDDILISLASACDFDMDVEISNHNNKISHLCGD